MRIAYFDCFSGISGDMTLGALIACGVPEGELRDQLSRLDLSGWELEVKETEQNGIGATDVTVRITEEQGHGRHLYHIEEILQKGSLPESVQKRALEVFTHLANAEMLDRLEPISAAGGFKLPRVCTPEELMGVSTYE